MSQHRRLCLGWSQVVSSQSIPFANYAVEELVGEAQDAGLFESGHVDAE
jgi:hypothetical protein